ncbi:MAG: response regulator [Hyphomonadaceae bacterium]
MGGRFLIVEDEFIIAEIIKDTLEAAGHSECRHVTSVAEALAAIADGPWAGAVVDLTLQGEQSFPVARELRARHIPFAFSSGDPSGAPAEFADVPLLPKPWENGALEELARRLLGAGA